MRDLCLKAIMVLIIAECLLQNYLVVEGSRYNEDLMFHSKKSIGTAKTIKEEGGEVVDCVDIYKQPTLNHSIQMDPPSFPATLRRGNADFYRASLKLGSSKDACPRGTVPIRRKLKHKFDTSILRLVASHSNGSMNHVADFNHKYSGITQSHDQHDICGADGDLNVWEPLTQKNEASVAHVQVASVKDASIIESISAGWMVSSTMYNDRRPRLFTYFTNNNYREGCFNLECPGFVQTHETIRPGEAIINPTSVYGGYQIVFNVHIVQDPKTKNWWLRAEDNVIGYWDTNLFPKLNTGSNMIGWGGVVIQHSRKDLPTHTQMGSGHFPDEGEKKAAFIWNMEYTDCNYMVHSLDETHTVASNYANCYGVTDVSARGPEGMLMFYYGGPGKGAPGCNWSN